MNRIATLAALGTLALSMTALPARAETHSIEVSHADLNLSTVEGRNALQSRVRSAARTVCGGRPDLRNRAAITAYGTCFSTAMKVSNAQIAARTAPVLASR